MNPLSRTLVAVAAMAACGAAAVDFGTLFHSAEERAQLDRVRRGEPAVPTALPERPTVPPEITGYVKRSDGRNTLWLDGFAVPTSSPRAAAILDPRNVRDDAARLPDSAIRSLGPAPTAK
jgi:hypothetical protein